MRRLTPTLTKASCEAERKLAIAAVDSKGQECRCQARKLAVQFRLLLLTVFLTFSRVQPVGSLSDRFIIILRRRLPMRRNAIALSAILFWLLGICSAQLNPPIALRSLATSRRNAGVRALTRAVCLALDSRL